MAYILTMTKDDLKQWREKQGYSQAALANALGVHVMTISKWERGIREIPAFLNLALRAIEIEGGEMNDRRKQAKTRKENKRHGKHL